MSRGYRKKVVSFDLTEGSLPRRQSTPKEHLKNKNSYDSVCVHMYATNKSNKNEFSISLNMCIQCCQQNELMMKNLAQQGFFTF